MPYNYHCPFAVQQRKPRGKSEWTTPASCSLLANAMTAGRELSFVQRWGAWLACCPWTVTWRTAGLGLGWSGFELFGVAHRGLGFTSHDLVVATSTQCDNTTITPFLTLFFLECQSAFFLVVSAGLKCILSKSALGCFWRVLRLMAGFCQRPCRLNGRLDELGIYPIIRFMAMWSVVFAAPSINKPLHSSGHATSKYWLTFWDPVKYFLINIVRCDTQPHFRPRPRFAPKAARFFGDACSGKLFVDIDFW